MKNITDDEVAIAFDKLIADIQDRGSKQLFDILTNIDI